MFVSIVSVFYLTAAGSRLGQDDPYHLAIVFLTESHPGGGWWYSSQYGNQASSQVGEKEFLSNCLSDLRQLARSAVTARIFGAACGINLPGAGVVGTIAQYLAT
jgi:hypothetical protein